MVYQDEGIIYWQPIHDWYWYCQASTKKGDLCKKSSKNDNVLVLVFKLVFWAAKVPGTIRHKDMMGTLPSNAIISVLVIKLVFAAVKVPGIIQQKDMMGT